MSSRWEKIQSRARSRTLLCRNTGRFNMASWQETNKFHINLSTQSSRSGITVTGGTPRLRTEETITQLDCLFQLSRKHRAADETVATLKYYRILLLIIGNDRQLPWRCWIASVFNRNWEKWQNKTLWNRLKELFFCFISEQGYYISANNDLFTAHLDMYKALLRHVFSFILSFSFFIFLSCVARMEHSELICMFDLHN